jgi:hypothetical protein
MQIIALTLTALAVINAPLALAAVASNVIKRQGVVTCSSLTGQACTPGTLTSGQCCSTNGVGYNAYVLCNNGASFNGDQAVTCGAGQYCAVDNDNNDTPQCAG